MESRIFAFIFCSLTEPRNEYLPEKENIQKMIIKKEIPKTYPLLIVF